MAVAQHVIKGLFKAKVASGCGFGMLIDSIGLQYQAWSMAGAFVRRFQWPCLGGLAGFLNSSGSGWPIYQGEPAAAAFPGRVALRPGEAFGDATTGHNTRRSYDLAATTLTDQTNSANVNNTYLGVYDTNGPWETDWAKNHSGVGVLIARTTLNSPTSWGIRMFNRGSSGALTAVNLNQAAAIRIFSSAATAQGSGGTSPVVMRLETGVENEAGKIAQILSFGFRLTTKTSGIFWATLGNGAWTTKCHSTSAGESITAEPPTYTGRYSDEALDAEVLGYGLNTFGIWLGQNAASDEWDGTTTRQYRTNILNIIIRLRASCARCGIANPIFVLFSTPDSSDTNAKFIAMAEDLQQIALSNNDVEFVDLRGHVFDNIGNSTARIARYPGDAIHPDNQNYRFFMADAAFALLNGSPRGVNLPTAAGPSSLFKLAWLGKGHTYRSAS